MTETTRTTKDTAIMIKVSNLYPHPDNPRKDLGDLTELVESIKKNGIMQNLTVIPIGNERDPEEQADAGNIALYSDFRVLIGHRRLAAAKKAGLESVPCRIVSNISRSDQIGIMLEENMQRNDLSIYEQAQSFQMMLDLGETEETISQKTGFGRTTIRHRLNIAKLDKRVMQRIDKDESFQLSFKDLYELEKIKDIKKRNEVLRDSRDSRDLASRAIQAAKQEEMDAVAKKVIELAEKRGIKLASDYANHRWDNTYTTVKDISLEEKAPERLRIGDDGELFYCREFRTIKILKKTPKKAKTPSKAELEQKDREKKIKEIKRSTKEIVSKVTDFVNNLLSGKIEPLKETDELLRTIWEAMLATGTYISESALVSFISGKEKYQVSKEEREATMQIMKNTQISLQMLTLLPDSLKGIDLVDWQGYYNQEKAGTFKMVIRALVPYGFSITEEDEKQILDGTHELYAVKEK